MGANTKANAFTWSLDSKPDGLKEVLVMWTAESESASFWLSVLTDLKARGVEGPQSFLLCLKEVYAVPTREAAEGALLGLELRWGSTYKYAIHSWQVNWAHLTAYFDFPLEIRRIIYTTNTT